MQKNKKETTNREAEKIIKEYIDVFKQIGKIEGKVSLEVDGKIKPTIQ